MTVIVYRSTDASAPVLTGTVGSFISVLDACLVNGYTGKAAAGWAKEFSGTNLAVYRAATGNRMRLRIDDTNAQESRWLGYETMTDVNTGTGPFPTATQVSGGMFMRKSNTADATARPWVLIANGTHFKFLPDSNQTVWEAGANVASGLSGQMFFGEIISYKPGDGFNTLVIGSISTSTSTGRLGMKQSAGISGGDTGHYMARSYTQIGASIQTATQVRGDYGGVTTIGTGSIQPVFPDSITGGLNLGQIEVIEPTATFNYRGTIPGLWGCLHNLPATHGDTLSGASALSGKTFLLATVTNGSTAGRAAFETSNTF